MVWTRLIQSMSDLNKRHLRPALPIALLVAAVALPACWFQSISASIAKPKVGYVRINEPVVVNFSEKIDANSLKLAVSPNTQVTITAKGKQLLVTAVNGWRPGEVYSLTVKDVSSADHSMSLSNWTDKFKTQPRVGVAGYLVDGKPVTTATGIPSIRPFATVTITFTTAMKVDTVTPTVNEVALPAAQLKWAADGKSVDIGSPGYLPYQAYRIGIAPQAQTASGDAATDVQELPANVVGLEPSNSSSQIPTGFQTPAAMLVVEDNAGLARPQAGLQASDMVFEYISEYGISRFTLVYFNNPPTGQIGPVRSCRMINPYLIEAFQGIAMCSGASDGTLARLWGPPAMRVNINDYDKGDHYFRVNYKPAPHNVFTDSGRILRLRQESNTPGGPFAIDVAHPDNGAGTAAGDPQVPLQGVGYNYDGGCQCYRPVEHGTPRVDALTGGNQLAVKNVVVMHVPFHNAGWVEDVNGGAQSIWYDMNGSGPAEVWSDGKLSHATWHQGTAGQNYFDNTTQPMVFTDEAGNLLRLNTGLTWVHVVGNGQTS